ncbi:pirin family protein [Pelagibacterales bacterium]|jgi:redox-sensitive bicupin YhaK (pirin superfamily)|nr:pirin family protein [Pelagibacterales bacterium]
MVLVSVKKILEPVPATDGAGVKLKRAIGTPELDYLDPFLMLDEFGSDNAEDYIAGFPPHPHRGIETVTYMLKGEFEHQDSTGAKGNMTSGDVQWMKTGRGIIHSEMPAMSEGKLQGFQLWINMPAELKKNKPEYIYIDSKQMQTYKDIDKKITIIAGKFKDVEGPVSKHNVEPIYFDVELKEGKEFNFELSSTHNSFIYLVEGSIKIGDQAHASIQNSKIIILNKENNLKVLGLKNSKFLLISGKPIGEPIVRGGPFVMNTQAEIKEAIQDFHNGTFAKY